MRDGLRPGVQLLPAPDEINQQGLALFGPHDGQPAERGAERLDQHLARRLVGRQLGIRALRAGDLPEQLGGRGELHFPRLRHLLQLLQRGGQRRFVPRRTGGIFSGDLDGHMDFAAQRYLAHRLADRRLKGLPLIGQFLREIEPAAVHRVHLHRQRQFAQSGRRAAVASHGIHKAKY